MTGRTIIAETPAVREFHELEVGMSMMIPFKITQDQMAAFESLSGDRSRIHLDHDFAITNGFAEPVVYGGLTVARLSHLVGMHLPGDLGLATSWRIDFHNPLYVGEEAWLEGQITHISEATNTVKLRFKVFAKSLSQINSLHEPKLISSGSAGSMLLRHTSRRA